jgi:hypothetical protein
LCLSDLLSPPPPPSPSSLPTPAPPQALVKKWTAWFRKYRPLLTSDIIHLHRPDGQQVDGYVHVNSKNEGRRVKQAAHEPTDSKDSTGATRTTTTTTGGGGKHEAPLGRTSNSTGVAGLRAIAVFFNPTVTVRTATMLVPLYYAGVRPGDKIVCVQEGDSRVGAAPRDDRSTRSIEGGVDKELDLGAAVADSRSRVQVVVDVGANAPTWVTCSDAQ